MPRQEVFCDLCGGKFFAHSLPIHRKKCKEKVATQLHECLFCGEMFTHLDMDAHVSTCRAAKAAGAKPTGVSAQLRQRLESDCPTLATQQGGTPRGRTPPPRSSTPIRRSNTPTPSRPEDGGSVGTPRMSRPSASLPEAPPVNLGLIPCQFCGRSFNMDRIAKHTSICQNLKSRPVFRSDQKRVYSEGGSDGSVISSGMQASSASGTQAKLKPKATSRNETVAPKRESNHSAKPSWREKSEAFREAMRAARGAASPSTPDVRPPPARTAQRRSEIKTAMSPEDSSVLENRCPSREHSPASDSSDIFGTGDLDKTLLKPLDRRSDGPKRSQCSARDEIGEVSKSHRAIDRRPCWNSNTDIDPRIVESRQEQQVEDTPRAKVKPHGHTTPSANPVRAKSVPKNDVRSSQTPQATRPGARTPPRSIRKSSTPPPRSERRNSNASTGQPQRTPKATSRPQERSGNGMGMSKAAQQHLADWGELDLEPERAFTPVGRPQKQGREVEVPKMDDFEECYRSRKRIGGGVGVSKAALQHAAVWEAMEQQHREAAAGCTPPRQRGSNKINPMTRLQIAQHGCDHDHSNSGYGNVKATNDSSRENPMARWR